MRLADLQNEGGNMLQVQVVSSPTQTDHVSGDHTEHKIFSRQKA